jgi:hypothetical protein
MSHGRLVLLNARLRVVGLRNGIVIGALQDALDRIFLSRLPVGVALSIPERRTRKRKQSTTKTAVRAELRSSPR